MNEFEKRALYNKALALLDRMDELLEGMRERLERHEGSVKQAA